VFSLLASVVQTFALGSGLDLITRLTEALNLDITSGGLSFLLAAALALAIVMAAGSLLFTVTAIVNAPQVVAWSRLGLPVDGVPTVGLPTVAIGSGLPAQTAPAAAAAPPVAVASSAPVFPGTPASGPAFATASPPAPEGAMAPAPVPEPATASGPPSELTMPAPREPMAAPTGWVQAAPPPPNAWAVAAAREEPFRWVTLPMRLTVIGMWLIAIASLVAGRAG
jgi:hypothetical protein